MGLFNDVRFYLMAALAVLFLLVVAMCSTAYDSSPDGHAASGVKHESDAAAAVAEKVDTDTATAAVAEPVKAVAEPVKAVETVTEEVAATPAVAIEPIKTEAFELAPLSTTGEAVTDYGTDLNNLKTDMGKYSGRVEGATGMLGTVKEALQK